MMVFQKYHLNTVLQVATHLYEITGHSTGFQAPTAVLKNPNPVEENDDMYHSGHRTRIKKPIDMGLLMELENSLSISEENDMVAKLF